MNPDPGHVDPALDALLRAHSVETPPAEVDATILAAAHRAVRSAPRDAEKSAEATRPWRWCRARCSSTRAWWKPPTDFTTLT